VALLGLVASISSCSAGDLNGFEGIRALEQEMYSKPHWNDCYYCANYAADRLSAQNGYTTMIVQGTSDESYNHEAMFIYMNEDKTWHKFESQRANWKNDDWMGVGYTALYYDWWMDGQTLTVVQRFNIPAGLGDPNLNV
jgi:hypothetical protein